MAHAIRPPHGSLPGSAERILRLVEEWKAITDPGDRRILLEELGYEPVDRRIARPTATSRMASGPLDTNRRVDHAVEDDAWCAAADVPRERPLRR
jgi:hypothetical protein